MLNQNTFNKLMQLQSAISEVREDITHTSCVNHSHDKQLDQCADTFYHLSMSFPCRAQGIGIILDALEKCINDITAETQKELLKQVDAKPNCVDCSHEAKYHGPHGCLKCTGVRCSRKY